MKLTISRTKGSKGIFRPVTVYYLNVEVDVTREEMALLKKEDRWEFSLNGGVIVSHHGQQTARNFVGRSTCWDFETVSDLDTFEHKLIRLMSALKERLRLLAIQERGKIEHAQRLKQQAADFTSEGPHEVEL